MDNKDGGGFWGFIFIALAIWGVYSIFFKQDNSSYSPYSSSYSESPRDCSVLEPNNPYNNGTGHYAGYEWSENNGGGFCNGNSNSFNEGCEEFNSQQEVYDECISR